MCRFIILEHRRLFTIVLTVVLSVVNISIFLFVFQYRQPLDADSLEYDSVAWSFSQGHGLMYEGHPYITKPPAYILFVTIIYTIFGHTPYAVLLMQGIIYITVCITLYFVCIKLLDEKTSRLSSILLATYFPLAYYTSGILTEIFITFIVEIVICLLMKKRNKIKMTNIFICGIFLGIAILCKPIFLLFPCIAMVYLIIHKFEFKEVLLYLGILLSSMIGILSIWVLRNYIVFNEFILLSKNNMGSLLLRSALDQDHKYLLWNDVHHWRQNNSGDPRKEIFSIIEAKVEEEIRLDPNTSKDRLYIKETVKLIRQEPLSYALGCLVRVVRFWISYPIRSGFLFRTFVMSYDVLLALIALTGFILSIKRWRELSIFWLPIVYLTIMHLPMHVEARYSAPVKPYMLVFTALGMSQIFQWLQLLTAMVRPKIRRR
jgi:4-amino-4-deoxy-L-arabinose transferase-like glycosyltransferase